MLTPDVREIHRAGQVEFPTSTNMHRDIEWEHRFTWEAARSAGVDPSGVWTFAQSRAHPGPIRNMPRRDLEVDAREELADCLNYCCWRALQLVRSRDAERLPAVGAALAHVLLAWHALDSDMK